MPKEILTLNDLPEPTRTKALTRERSVQEIRTNPLSTLTIAQVDTFVETQVDAITNLAEAKAFLKVFLKRLSRYLLATQGRG